MKSYIRYLCIGSATINFILSGSVVNESMLLSIYLLSWALFYSWMTYKLWRY